MSGNPDHGYLENHPIAPISTGIVVVYHRLNEGSTVDVEYSDDVNRGNR